MTDSPPTRQLRAVPAARRTRLTGCDRELVRADLVLRYVGQGQSIRTLVTTTGRPYTTVRRLLAEADVLREHGTSAPRHQPDADGDAR